MQKIQKMQEQRKEKIMLIPMGMLCFIPLLVYGKAVDTNLIAYPWYNDVEQVVNMFTYYKMIATMAVATLMLGVLFAYRKTFFTKEWKRYTVWIPLLIYIIGSLLSAVLSQYKETAFCGYMELSEHIGVLFSYCIICFYSSMVMRSVSSEKLLQGFSLCFSFAVAGVGLIGTLQMLGFDIYAMEMMQKLIMPGKLQGIELTFMVEKGRTYSSLANPNYVGVFACITLPILAVFALETTSVKHKIIHSAAFLLMLFSLLGSKSKSGMMVAFLCLGCLLFCYRERLLKKTSIGILLCVIIGSIAVLAVGVTELRQALGGREEKNAQSLIDVIETGEDAVMVQAKGRTFMLSLDIEGSTIYDILQVCDENGQSYVMQEQEYDVLHFVDSELSDITVGAVQFGDYISMDFCEAGRHWYFTNQTEDGTYYYVTQHNKLDKIHPEEPKVFHALDGKESWISGRGYIWSRTLPLLAENIVKGDGPDSFVHVFPNDDYIGKAKWGYENILISKPHSFYLQSWIQTGGISTMAFVFFCLKLLYHVIALCRKRVLSDKKSSLLKGLGIGIVAFLIMGLTNDSSIGVTLLFWMIMGVTIGIIQNEKQI